MMDKLYKLKNKYEIAFAIIILSSILICVLCFVFINNLEINFYIISTLILIDLFILLILYHIFVIVPYKTIFVKSILEEYKPGLKYQYQISGSEYKYIIQTLNIFPKATNFSCTDAITDEIDGYKYQSVDLYAYHTEGGGKSKKTVVDFHGKAYLVTVPTKYTEYVLKEEKIKKIPEGYSCLTFEVIDFNNKFHVYVKDQFEAQKIFTPSKIKDLLKIEGMYENIISLASFSGKLLILLHDKSDQFENVKAPKSSIIFDYKIQYSKLKDYLNVLLKYYD